ncbi:LCP family protein [Candidatus Saccharibacteria bacterium]|nr:LCP family protein [Candidatus Saccharibacteria bacterium]
MQSKKRVPKNASMDGFVRRRPQSQDSQRPDLSQSRKKSEGFTRRTAADQKIAFADEAWSDDNTLTLGLEASDQQPQKKAHWWQFKKKRAERATKQTSPTKRKLKRALLVVLLVLLLVGGFLGWKFLNTSSKVFDGNVLGFLNTTKLKGEEEGRVNIILAGTSEDDPDHGGAALTDSIMLVSVDTKNNTAFTTSIPRDLWVKYGEQCAAGYEGKINNAYQCGESVEFSEPGYPKGGMGLLSKIVSTNFGIPIHYYGKLNYTAFKDAVDAVGGITITVDSDDPRGIYDPNIQPKDGGPVRLKNGSQKLDGLSALALARSRNVKGGYGMSRGDFDRTTYQRAMLLALKDKALSAGVLSNPSKIGGLLDAAGDNVSTNFNTSELRRLYDLSKLVENKNIESIDLADPETNLLKTGMYNGQSIVMPTAGINNFTQLKSYIKKLTSTDPLVKEGATAVILNGSGTTGLAQKYADTLSEKGITVLVTSNASTERTSNVVVDLSGGTKPGTKAFLEKNLSTTATTDKKMNPEALRYTADFVIILGKPKPSTTQ